MRMLIGGFVLAAVVIVGVGLWTFLRPTQPNPINMEHAYECTQLGGVWNATYNECEGDVESWCQVKGGTFQSCASACRHKSLGGVCTMQCIKVCQF